MRKKAILFVYLCVTTGICGLYAKLYNDSLIIHPFIRSNKTCMECHIEKNVKTTINNPAHACSTQCLSCHKEMNNHHITDIRINETLTERLILSEKKKILCITCHNLGERRYDSKSWKAESLYEKIFKNKKQYKTYYLIKRNNDGQLCKICH